MAFPVSLFICMDNCIFVELNTEMQSIFLRLVVMGERGYKVHTKAVTHWSLALDIGNIIMLPTYLKVHVCTYS